MDQFKMKARRFNNKPFVTYSILGLTIIMFLLQSFLGGSTNLLTLVRLGAKVNEFIIGGQYWRLITPMFLHIGMSHIVLNGIIIYFLGIQLEYVLGHWRFALIYLLSGVAGNAASFAFNESISAGASTALFGMFAATLVLGKLYPTKPQFKALARNYTVLIVLNVVFGLMSANVDNAGHLGGLIGGYFLTYAISAPYAWNKKEKRIVCGVGYVLLLLLLIGIGWTQYFHFNF